MGAYCGEELNKIQKQQDNPAYMTAVQIKKLFDMHQLEVETCNPNIIEISYEDFVKDPKQNINTILDFVNLNQDWDLCFKYLKSLSIYNRNKKDEEYFTNKEFKSFIVFLNNNLKTHLI